MNIHRRIVSSVLAGAALMTCPLLAIAADHEAGVPLTPAEAVGAWTLESGGRSVCILHLSAARAGRFGYGLRTPQS
jgi:hypothetical protein